MSLGAHFDELYAFFAKGDPPLAVQLLALNTIFLMIVVIRRMRGAPTLRRETSIVVQSMLIFANAVIMFREDIGHLFRIDI